MLKKGEKGEEQGEEKQNKKKKRKMDETTASQTRLIINRLKKHHLARISIVILAMFYIGVIFAPFLAIQANDSYSKDYVNTPPTKVHLFHQGALTGPFVYGLKQERHPETLRRIYVEDEDTVYPVKLLKQGSEYKLLGFIKTDRHLFGVEEPGAVFLFGSDSMGRDIYSRVLLGSQVSLTIPLVGVSISLVIGLFMGGISGYFGGVIDNLIQRLIEIIRSFPTLPLWMALSAAIPPRVPVVQMYLYIVIIIAFIDWTSLARVVRSQFMSMRNEDYVMAAKISGSNDFKIITKEMLPGMMSYLVVNITMSIPNMIIGETSMSFLGLGIRPPATSWGVLLQEAQKLENIVTAPWKLIPVIFVVVAVLAFNFLGDGLRDATDPHKNQ